jgi:hypothetical protein
MQNAKGTYAGYNLAPVSADRLVRFLKDNGIPCSQEEFHVTLLYSRKDHSEQFSPNPDLFHMAFHDGYALFDSHIPGCRCLVMKLRCPSLIQRHVALMAELGATYDYPIYNPHITLSCSVPEDFSTFKLPTMKGSLMLVGEYYEPLNELWGSEEKEAAGTPLSEFIAEIESTPEGKAAMDEGREWVKNELIPSINQPVPVQQVLNDPDHPAHSEVKEVIAGLESGKLSMCACIGKVGNDPHCPCEMKRLGLKSDSEPTDEDKKKLQDALDRILARTENEEGDTEDAEAVQEEDVQGSAEKAGALEEKVTVVPGGGAFPFHEIREATSEDLPPPGCNFDHCNDIPIDMVSFSDPEMSKPMTDEEFENWVRPGPDNEIPIEKVDFSKPLRTKVEIMDFAEEKKTTTAAVPSPKSGFTIKKKVKKR